MAKREFDLDTGSQLYGKYEAPGAFAYYLNGNSWNSIPLVKRPLKVNYVYDESLDTFQAGFLSETISSKLPNKTLCTIIYEGYEPTYDAQGKPLNHDQCVIANGTCVYQPNSNYFDHDYNLVELIDILKDVRMETLTFTSFDVLKVTDPVTSVVTTYVHEQNNLFKMLERILKVTKPSTGLEDNSWFAKIKIMDIDLLKASGVGADDVFVENTLYDALFKIGHYIGRVPVLYINKDYDPTISGSQEYLLFYERKDGISGTTITKEELFANHGGWVEQENDGKDADTVVSDVRNMVSNRPCSYPSDDYFCFATGEESLFEINTSTPRKIILPHKISEVIQVVEMNSKSIVNPRSGETYSATLRYTIIKVYKYENWVLRSDRENCMYYREGDNTIFFGNNLGRAHKTLDGYTMTQMYNVKYYPMLDGKVVAIKGSSTKYDTTFNQVDNYIDSSTYGNMLQEYINQHGNADVTLTKTYYFMDNHHYSSLPKIGTNIVYPNGDKYLITNMSIDADIFGYKCIFQLNKDYVRRNAYTRASQRIRNEGINHDKMYERFTNISELAYVNMTGLASASINNNQLKYLANKKPILSGLITDQNAVKNLLIQSAYIGFYSYAPLENGTNELINNYILANVAKTQSGNSVILNVKMDDANNTAPTIIGERSGSSPGDVIQTQTRFTYTDPFGEIKEFDIGFGRFNDVPADYSFDTDIVLSDASPQVEFGYKYPFIDEMTFITHYASSAIKIPLVRYQKDAREIFNFTYQLHIRGGNGTIVSSKFVELSGLLGRREIDTPFYILILKTGESVSAEDIILQSQVEIPLLITNIVYYNEQGSVKLELGGAYNYSGKKMVLAYIENNVYKPLLISAWENGLTTNAIYIHV